MALKGVGSVREGGSGPSSGEGEGSWARVVAGRGQAVEWSSSPLSIREVGDLEAFFSTALVLPGDEIGEEREKWEGKALIVRSLGRRVPPAWAGRDMRLRLGLRVEPEVTPIADDHFMVRFEEEAACVKAIQEAPWVVGGQLLALEPWRPAFVPARQPVTKAVVWLRLPGLPVECWRPSFILAIAAQAGKPISLDSFTEKQRRKGFARVKVELDSRLPVKPGVVVEAAGERFWQQFQFENLPPVCFLCGLLGHVESGCGGGSAGRSGGVPGMPRLGPWISTSRIRQHRGFPSGGSRWAGSGPSKSPPSGPSSSSPGTNPRSSSSPPGSPPDSEGWQKPSKVARRVRVLGGEGDKSSVGVEILGGLDSRGQPSGSLSVGGEPMEVGVVPVSAVECRMVDGDQPLLKRPWSPSAKGKGCVRAELTPSKLPAPASSRSTSGLLSPSGSSLDSSPASVSVLAPQVEGQVRPFSSPRLVAVGGSALVPIEVMDLVEGREGRSDFALGVKEGGLCGASLGVVGAAGGSGRGGVGGKGAQGGVAGGLGLGGNSLVRVGIREVVGRRLEDVGGDSSVATVACAVTGAGLAVGGGENGGRVLEFGAEGGGPGGNRGIGGCLRARSRSPGRLLRREGGEGLAGPVTAGEGGGLVASDGVPVGVSAWVGSHDVAVEEVRGVVRKGDAGSENEEECSGASASC